jgi:hypothetical protein
MKKQHHAPQMEHVCTEVRKFWLDGIGRRLEGEELLDFAQKHLNAIRSWDEKEDACG